ncbi:MAG: hypothetical protein HC826_02215 [Rhodospirillales bacterium]|nr:hypothetical protein [Rhodospirillales bacterium]
MEGAAAFALPGSGSVVDWTDLEFCSAADLSLAITAVWVLALLGYKGSARACARFAADAGPADPEFGGATRLTIGVGGGSDCDVTTVLVDRTAAVRLAEVLAPTGELTASGWRAAGGGAVVHPTMIATAGSTKAIARR